jgi:hypothetical protein
MESYKSPDEGPRKPRQMIELPPKNAPKERPRIELPPLAEGPFKQLREKEGRLVAGYYRLYEIGSIGTYRGWGEESGSSFPEIRVGPGNSASVVLREGQTNKEALQWMEAELKHGRQVKVSAEWQFKFDGARTKVTEALVTRLSISEESLARAGGGGGPPKPARRVLFDCVGNLY